MKEVSVIIPSWHYWADPFKLQPLWELYYATQIQNGHPNLDVSVLDLRNIEKNLNFEEYVQRLPEKDAYIYWIMKSGDSVEIASIVKILKERYPKAVHIAGGTHVDMCTEECEKIFDAVVVGPGEQSLVSALKEAEEGNLLKNYTMGYKEQPFDKTPFPIREFIPPERIVNTELFKKYGGVPGTSMYMSRGCVYNCSYCVYNVPNTFQIRSSNMILKEIEYLKKQYKVEGINLRDEVVIHPNEKISFQMMEALGKANVIWRGQTTSLATKEQLRLARETGCQELSVGVETVDNAVMQIIDKPWQSEKRIRDFMKNAKQFGIRIKMCLIFGLPGEPRNIVEKTISFIEDTQPDFISLSGFCPIPGSPIFRDPKKYGIKFIDKDWSKHAHLLYRFSEEEEVGLPFTFEDYGPWGKNFTRDEIIENIRSTQKWLDQRAMTY